MVEAEDRSRTAISEVRVELGREISAQTRWIVVALGAAAVLLPIVRAMAALLPSQAWGNAQSWQPALRDHAALRGLQVTLTQACCTRIQAMKVPAIDDRRLRPRDRHGPAAVR